MKLEDSQNFCPNCGGEDLEMGMSNWTCNDCGFSGKGIVRKTMLGEDSEFEDEMPDKAIKKVSLKKEKPKKKK